jgi:hypothetical protein
MYLSELFLEHLKWLDSEKILYVLILNLDLFYFIFFMF